MIGIYDASKTRKKLPLIAGEDVLSKYHISIDPNFGSKYCYLFTEINGQAVYIVRFQCNFVDEQGSRSNTRIAVHAGEPESPEALKREVKTTLEKEHQLNGEITDFLASYHKSGAGHLRNAVKKIETKLSKTGRAEIKVGSARTAGGITGILHDHEIQSNSLYPVAATYQNDGMDNFGFLKNLTGGNGVHIVIDEYNTEGIQFHEESGLLGKVKGLF